MRDLHVHYQDYDSNDTYQVKQVFEVKDAITPVTFPDVVIELAKLFP